MYSVNISIEDIYKGVFEKCHGKEFQFGNERMGVLANRFLKITLATVSAKPSIPLKPRDHPSHPVTSGFREDTWVNAGTGGYFGAPIGRVIGVKLAVWALPGPDIHTVIPFPVRTIPEAYL